MSRRPYRDQRDMLYRHPHYGGCLLQRVHRQTALRPYRGLSRHLVMLLTARKGAKMDPNASNKPKECKISGGFALCAGRRCAERTEGKILAYDELYVLAVWIWS
jgi:hypothetical protein